MIVDAVEDVGQVGLGIQAIQFGRLNQSHGAHQSFCTGIGPCKEPIFPSDSNRTHCSLGGVIVNCHATILKEQAKRWPAAQAITESLGQIAFAGDARQFLFSPLPQGVDLWFALRLAHLEAGFGRLPGDLALDVVKLSDPVEGLTGDL